MEDSVDHVGVVSSASPSTRVEQKGALTVPSPGMKEAELSKESDQPLSRHLEKAEEQEGERTTPHRPEMQNSDVQEEYVMLLDFDRPVGCYCCHYASESSDRQSENKAKRRRITPRTDYSNYFRGVKW